MQKRKTFILFAILSGALVNACDNETSGIDTKTCASNYEFCGDICCYSQSCVDGICQDSNHEKCGAESIQCHASESCIKGVCTPSNNAPTTCPSGQETCNDTCVNISSDILNCGKCGNSCKDNETCLKGECTIKCPGNRTLIDGQCIDTSSDSDHCGADNVKCPENTWCYSGNCECTKGYIDCDNDPSTECVPLSKCLSECEENTIRCSEGGKCIDTQTDPQHCGDCDTTCTNAQTCIDGECKDREDCDENGNCGPIEGSCKPEQTVCYGKCTDILTDTANCGACLNQCDTGESCIEGKCELTCGSLTACGNTCVDFQTNADHCGDCDTKCSDGQVCTGGLCQCAEGYIDCDNDLFLEDGVTPNPNTNGCESPKAECSCKPGESRPCWRGDESNVVYDENHNLKEAKGICELSTQTCDPSGRFWGSCQGGVYPSSETCDEFGNLNGLDNDCDGEIDTICRSECDLIAGDMSYIGCEYWGAYLDNLITDASSNFTFVFSNPGEKEAIINIFDKEQAANSSAVPVKTQKLAPHEVVTVQLSSLAKNMSKGSGIYNNAYRIRSTQPITAYQFSPFGSAAAHSNDASLLLPANVLGRNYIGMTWHSDTGNDHRSYLAVIATQPGTTKVTIKSAAVVSASDANVLDINGAAATQTKITAMTAGEEREFELKRFEVLTLMSPASSAHNQTGTTISADKNIAVFGGSRASYVPSQAVAGCCRDHVEEQLVPTQAWGKAYFAARAYSTGTAGDFWLITAREDDTTITLPADLKTRDGSSKTAEFKATIGGTIKLNAGQTYPVFETRDNFEIKADKPISVGQFTPSQSYNGLTIGDPSFIVTVPYEQYRSDYDFVVSQSFDVDYLTVIHPENAQIQLDGKTLTTADFVGTKSNPITGTGFAVSYIKINPGVHHMNADAPFGLYSYGYFNMSSYGYPIGLDLKILNTN